ncbi:MAG: hypothetical protein ACREN8_11140 [Candidatus Dormibacteraceae bacterium]
MRGRIDRGASSAGDIVTGTVFTGIFGTAAGVLAAGHPVWAGFEAGVATVAAGFTGWEVARVARAKRRGDREVH